MPSQRLHQALKTLHEELEAGAPVSDADRELLQRVAEDVDRVLEEDELGQILKERAELMAAEFEADHPQAARILAEVVQALARMGI